jgi:hypothetical protein
MKRGTCVAKLQRAWVAMAPVMGTHSFIRYIVTVTVTSLVTTITNEHLQ